MFDKPRSTSAGTAEECVDADTWEALAAAEPELAPLDHVTEVDDMITIFAAERYHRIEGMRRAAIAEALAFGGPVAEIAERSLRLQLAAALRITEHAADALIARSQALVNRYPALLESMSRARVTERHAVILIEALDAAEPEVRDKLVGRAIALAEAQPVGQFRRSLRSLVDSARSETLAARHEEALKKRRVGVELADDGMAWLTAFMPAVEAHAAFGRLTAMGNVLADHPDETRSLDQLRADIAADLLLDGGASVHPPEARGIRATVAVTVPALTLIESGRDESGDCAAVVEGVGPVPLDRARELCGGDEGWMRVLTHPETGMVLSVGRDRYRPPAALRRLVKWRADRCMAPGCGMPADRCEIDHTLAWEDGGATTLENLAPLCKGHHTVKHHGRWRVNQIPGSGGALEWVTPSGRRYVVQPQRRVPVFRPHPPSPADDPPPF